MRKELRNKLLGNYSKLFNPESPPHFECGSGWYELLDNLFYKLSNMQIPDDYRIVGAKQKYARLEIYGRPYNDVLSHLLDDCSVASMDVCEECGGTQNVRTITIHGWDQVACYSCRQMLKAGWNEKAAQFNEGDKLAIKAILDRLIEICNEEMEARFPGGEIKVVLQGVPKRCHIVVRDAAGRVYAT